MALVLNGQYVPSLLLNGKQYERAYLNGVLHYLPPFEEWDYPTTVNMPCRVMYYEILPYSTAVPNGSNIKANISGSILRVEVTGERGYQHFAKIAGQSISFVY